MLLPIVVRVGLNFKPITAYSESIQTHNKGNSVWRYPFLKTALSTMIKHELATASPRVSLRESL